MLITCLRSCADPRQHLASADRYRLVKRRECSSQTHSRCLARCMLRPSRAKAAQIFDITTLVHFVTQAGANQSQLFALLSLPSKVFGCVPLPLTVADVFQHMRVILQQLHAVACAQQMSSGQCVGLQEQWELLPHSVSSCNNHAALETPVGAAWQGATDGLAADMHLQALCVSTFGTPFCGRFNPQSKQANSPTDT